MPRMITSVSKPSSLRGVVILGSTGSIGTSTIDVCRNLGPDRIRVVGLAAGSQWQKLAEQARALEVPRVSIADPKALAPLQEALAGTGCEVLLGDEGATGLVEHPDCDTVLAAISGAAGLPAVLAAARHGRRICLSNKESLVLTGPLLGALAEEHGAELLPVDSEHSAIFQCLRSGSSREAKRLVLTASGGPFRTWTAEEMANASREQALKHPTWSMGPFITIDSATLMNKALELIEARWLFGLPAEQIEIVVHPQSIVHSFVEFVDGSVLAQMGVPDMRVPIQYALTFPERFPLETDAFDLAKIASLTFEEVDRVRFPAVDLAYEVLRRGGVSGAVFNASNEIARTAFYEGQIGFTAIVETTATVLERHAAGGPSLGVETPTLEEVLAADAWAREEARACLTS